MVTMLLAVTIAGAILLLTGILLLFCPGLKDRFPKENIALILTLPPIAVASYVLIFSLKTNKYGLTPPGWLLNLFPWGIGENITLAKIVWASLWVFVFFLLFAILIAAIMWLFKK